MSVTLTFHTPGSEPFEVELEDATFAFVQAFCELTGVTIAQFFASLIRTEIATHPIIAQTRTVQ